MALPKVEGQFRNARQLVAMIEEQEDGKIVVDSISNFGANMTVNAQAMPIENGNELDINFYGDNSMASMIADKVADGYEISTAVVAYESEHHKGQGYDDEMDESLGMRHRGSHKQSMKDRRDEASAMDKRHSKMGRKYDDGYRTVNTTRTRI